MRQLVSSGLCRVVVVMSSLAAAEPVQGQPRALVPDAQAQEASRQAASELFRARFQRAKTSADKTALAREMIDAALKVENGSADQFALLEIARDIATGAGDVAVVLQAVEVLTKRFDLPSGKVTAEALLAAAVKASASSQHKALAEAAPRTVTAAAEANEYDLALRLCEAGRLSAQKAREPALAKPFAALREDLKQRQTAFQQYREALAVLENDPVEPAANSAAGRYLCSVKGDWERGLAMLARGSDSNWKAVATKDLSGAPSAEEQAALGDQWWALADTQTGLDKEASLLRAGSWYRRAESGLAAGLGRLKVTSRLREVVALGRALPELVREQPPPGKAQPPASVLQQLSIAKGETRRVTSVTSSLAFSPDGRTLVSSGGEQEVLLVNVALVSITRRLRGHADLVRAVAFAPDGRLVASGDMGGVVRLWNADTGEMVRTWRGHRADMYAMAFSPDGRSLASCGRDRAVRVWEVPTGREQAVLTGHDSWIWTVDFSPDGKWLASAGGADNTARVWDVAAAKQLAICQGHEGKVRTVRFLPGGATLLSSSDDRTVRFWNPQTGQPQRVIRDEQGLFSADVSPDGRTLVTCGSEGVIKFWDVASGRLLHTDQTAPPQLCWGLRFSPSGRQLALGGDAKTLQVWTLTARE
jgi:hypothetical protein